MNTKLGILPVAEEYCLPALHPAVCEINSLRERVAALEKELGRPFVQEDGPWTADPDGQCVMSDDFTHDVVLGISGDFTPEDRGVYAREIARRLNLYSGHPHK